VVVVIIGISDEERKNLINNNDTLPEYDELEMKPVTSSISDNV
jgi:hypothetical protein